MTKLFDPIHGAGFSFVRVTLGNIFILLRMFDNHILTKVVMLSNMASSCMFYLLCWIIICLQRQSCYISLCGRILCALDYQYMNYYIYIYICVYIADKLGVVLIFFFF